MNMHDLLTKAGYTGRPDYPQIARRAAAPARQNLTSQPAASLRALVLGKAGLLPLALALI